MRIPPIALVLVAASLAAAIPEAGAQPRGGGPGAEYTADFKIQDYGGPKVRGRVYGAPGRERRETPDPWGGTTLILRYDLGVAWTILPGGRQYTEFPLRTAGMPSAAPGTLPPGLVRLEEDDINDIPATRYSFPPTNTGPGGEIWLTRESIALRIDSAPFPGGPRVRYELDNLTYAPQNPALFELPQGIQKVAGPPPSTSVAPPPGGQGQRPPN